MTGVRNSLYFGDVVHKRLARVDHALSYRVFSLLVDVADLDALGSRLTLFSYNNPNLISLYDRDFGAGESLPDYLKGIADHAGLGKTIHRFVMLCYPRVLGYVFNPITVYYGLDAADATRLTIYEVTNTFGERKTYVIPASPDAQGQIWQKCPKQFFVSPFNKVSGIYSFHHSAIGEQLTLGVALKDNGKPVLRAHFAGNRRALTDKMILKSLGQTGLMTIKVMAGIHIEAAKLWIKGLRTHAKPSPPRHAITYFADPLSGRVKRPDDQKAADPVGKPLGKAKRSLSNWHPANRPTRPA